MGKYKSANIWKTADRRAKRTEIWDSGHVVGFIWGTFDLLSVKVILGSFGALWKFLNFTFSKRYSCYSFQYFSTEHFIQVPHGGLHKS